MPPQQTETAPLRCKSCENTFDKAGKKTFNLCQSAGVSWSVKPASAAFQTSRLVQFYLIVTTDCRKSGEQQSLSLQQLKAHLLLTSYSLILMNARETN